MQGRRTELRVSRVVWLSWIDSYREEGGVANQGTALIFCRDWRS